MTIERLTIQDLKSFPRVPWKNGNGHTRELAASDSGMDSKEPVWRISQADIVHNTAFSSFPYYNRSLVLIDGAGLGLTHVDQPPHTLKKPLDTAHFSGKYETLPTLIDGSVRVLNIMAQARDCQVKLTTVSTPTTVHVDCTYLALFVVSGEPSLDRLGESELVSFSAENFVQIYQPCSGDYRFSGGSVIVIQLS